MNWADWAIIAIVFTSVIISLMRGFVREIFSLAVWVLALLAANIFSHKIEFILEPLLSTPSVKSMTAFVIVFVAVLVAGYLLSLCLSWLVKAVGLTVTDRVIGVGFGLVRGLFIAVVLIIYVPEFITVKNDPWYKQSQIIPYFKPFETRVKELTGEFSYWALGLMSDEHLKNDTKALPDEKKSLTSVKPSI